jgi:hypothetical protein
MGLSLIKLPNSDKTMIFHNFSLIVCHVAIQKFSIDKWQTSDEKYLVTNNFVNSDKKNHH